MIVVLIFMQCVLLRFLLEIEFSDVFGNLGVAIILSGAMLLDEGFYSVSVLHSLLSFTDIWVYGSKVLYTQTMTVQCWLLLLLCIVIMSIPYTLIWKFTVWSITIRIHG